MPDSHDHHIAYAHGGWDTDRVTEGVFRAGSGEPMVLLHIGRRPWLKWESCLPALTEHFDVLVPTYPGCEGGESLPGPATIEIIVDGIERSMDAAGFAKAHCVGNSLGGWIAFELARRGRATSAVAFSPGGGWPRRWQQLFVRLFFIFNRALNAVSKPIQPAAMSVPVIRGLLLRGVIENGGTRVTREQALAIASDSTKADWRNFGHLLRDVARPYPDLEVPMLVAWGEMDRLTPLARDGKFWRDATPHVEFRVLPGLGHMVMFDDPEVTTRTILEVTAKATPR